MSRLAFVLLTVVLALSAAPVTALAADPPSGPAVIVSDGFEDGVWFPSAATRPYQVGPLIGLPNYDGNRYWGRISARYRTGAKALWCNGSASPVPNPLLYTARSAGFARFELTQTADYYSASASFWYLMPSLGAYDQNSFVTQWGPDPFNEYIRDDYPITSTWRQVAWNLTPSESYLLRYSLSRKPGYLAFEFKDEIFGNRVGEGPTIDDVLVTGYRFGPVRTLAAAATPSGDASITWLRPYRSPGASVLEERAIVYRVWRSPATASPPQWTEVATSVTDDGTAALFTDTTVAPGSAYRYRVHAWSATGSDFGEPAETTVIMPSADASVSFETTVTRSLTVTATSDCPAAAGGGMRWRVGTSWSSWVPYSATTKVTLTPGDGLKIVEFEYADSPSGPSAGQDPIARASASITLDQTGPVSVFVEPAEGFAVTAGVPVLFTASTADGAGLSSAAFRVRRGDGMYWNGTGWQSGEAWLQATTTNGFARYSLDWTPPADTDWTRNEVRVTARAVDGVGNAGPGVSRTSAKKMEMTPSTSQAYTIGYGAAQTISGRLRTAYGLVNVPGQTVRLQRLVGSTWTNTAAAVTSSTGVVTFSVKPSSKTTYRLFFEGAAGYLKDASASITVTPRVYLGAPSKPSTVRRGVSFAAAGALKPRHAAGSTPVRVLAYRLEGGKWVHRYTFVARASDYSDYSRYAASVKLSLAGRWTLRAYAPADSGHAATWSSYSASFVVP